MVATQVGTAVVSPPVALPPAPGRSLLSALPPVPMEPRAEVGVSHVMGRGALPFAYDFCNPAAVSIADDCAAGYRQAFIVLAGELRPNETMFAALRTNLQARQDSARVNLEYHESFVIARELMYGTGSVANGWANPYLFDPARLQIVTTAAQPYNKALDRLTDRWAKVMGGERGLIHTPPAVARQLLGNYMVDERGNLLYDRAMGHQIVVDAGYAGADPDGAGLADPSTAFDPYSQIQWLVMSPNIDIRVSRIEFLPATDADMAMSINRAANTLVVVAYHAVSYTYETPAGATTVPPVLAIPVDLCSADCIPGAS